MHICNLCFLCVFCVIFLYSFLLQYFDTVGWVFCPVKTVSHITYTVLEGTSLCGSHPLVTHYYCRLGDLLCSVFVFAYCMLDLSVYYLFLQYFDTVGWVL